MTFGYTANTQPFAQWRYRFEEALELFSRCEKVHEMMSGGEDSDMIISQLGILSAATQLGQVERAKRAKESIEYLIPLAQHHEVAQPMANIYLALARYAQQTGDFTARDAAFAKLEHLGDNDIVSATILALKSTYVSSVAAAA